jgi:uncharacterized delta-60 repeat protein
MTLSHPKANRSPGTPDPAFGDEDSIAYLSKLLDDDPAFQVLALFMGLSSDLQGKTIFSAYVHHEEQYKYVIGRTDSDGTLDRTFANNGILLGSFNSGAACSGGKLVVQQSEPGLIYMQGWTEGPSGWADLAITCVDKHGQPNPSFGNNGSVVIATPVYEELLTNSCTLQIQPDGKLLVTANYLLRHNELQLTTGVVFRLLSNGEPDTGFNGNGRWELKIPDPHAATAINGCLSQGGNVVIAGHVRAQPAHNVATLVRLKHNGEVDRDFADSSGFHFVDLPDHGSVFNTVIERADHSLIAAGEAFTRGAPHQLGLLVALTPNGSPHLMFNQGKPLLTQFDAERENHWSCALVQPDNKIVVAAAFWWPLLARFNVDGSLDTTFNSTGYTPADFTIKSAPVQLVSRQDGRIIVSANITGVNPEGIGVMKCFLS